ncbi:uncharacterized protein AMSG_11086 [Thecamonas trahens ATCC 50062]|uniref:Uncharacterized protein n=1 Tax=Thecamonas trahens ATCC 50062 TaxID=461836 RepID=A0A0L0DSU4_THETB|nr:hypothetical protein AMSG_11086 [Thecamonas trahens ATCC 50062]KNC55424.1 hypothetical protein AMSG_11086 [Thecamonas trahens ATCC 50062]|eukprot:XP_013752963.1 hypothetical protein AMSG_11086 [Thecamonas trahens ATCC 50062]
MASRDWNAEFQTLLELPVATPHERLVRAARLYALTSTFAETAQAIARIIVDEAGLPQGAPRRILPATEAGGVAGGEKYVVASMFFKFATDSHGIYAGAQFAIAAAGLELEGLRAFLHLDMPDLHFPLMTILDYRGHRIIASSLLPIDGSASLIYGSDDGAITVHDDDPVFNTIMAAAAELLNLAPHPVGRAPPYTTICGPADIEGHRGSDGKYYLLDTARVFPPEEPSDTAVGMLIPPGPWREANASITTIEVLIASWNTEVLAILSPQASTAPSASVSMVVAGELVVCFTGAGAVNEVASALADGIIRGPAVVLVALRGSVLYRHLPANLVAGYTASPLSSDAFTGFGRADAAVYNANVRLATAHLRGSVLPEFVARLESASVLPVSGHQITQWMEDLGIPERYLGLVRISLKSEVVASLVLTHMVAIVTARALNTKMRQCLDPSPRAVIALAVTYLNTVLGSSEVSTFFWTSEIKVRLHISFGLYGSILSGSESDPKTSLVSRISKLALFDTVTRLTGVAFDPAVRSAAQSESRATSLTVRTEGLFRTKDLARYFAPVIDDAAPTAPPSEDASDALIARLRARHRLAVESLSASAPLALGSALDAALADNDAALAAQVLASVEAPGAPPLPLEVVVGAYYVNGVLELEAAHIEDADRHLSLALAALELGTVASQHPLGLLIFEALTVLNDATGNRVLAAAYSNQFCKLWSSFPLLGDRDDFTRHFRGRVYPLAYSVAAELGLFRPSDTDWSDDRVLKVRRQLGKPSNTVQVEQWRDAVSFASTATGIDLDARGLTTDVLARFPLEVAGHSSVLNALSTATHAGPHRLVPPPQLPASGECGVCSSTGRFLSTFCRHCMSAMSLIASRGVPIVHSRGFVMSGRLMALSPRFYGYGRDRIGPVGGAMLSIDMASTASSFYLEFTLLSTPHEFQIGLAPGNHGLFDPLGEVDASFGIDLIGGKLISPVAGLAGASSARLAACPLPVGTVIGIGFNAANERFVFSLDGEVEPAFDLDLAPLLAGDGQPHQVAFTTRGRGPPIWLALSGDARVPAGGLAAAGAATACGVTVDASVNANLMRVQTLPTALEMCDGCEAREPQPCVAVCGPCTRETLLNVAGSSLRPVLVRLAEIACDSLLCSQCERLIGQFRGVCASCPSTALCKACTVASLHDPTHVLYVEAPAKCGALLRHSNVRCDGCRITDLAGTRYKCRECADFDLCEACHAKGAGVESGSEHTSEHTFTAIPLPSVPPLQLAPSSLVWGLGPTVRSDEGGSSAYGKMTCMRCEEHIVGGAAFLACRTAISSLHSQYDNARTCHTVMCEACVSAEPDRMFFHMCSMSLPSNRDAFPGVRIGDRLSQLPHMPVLPDLGLETTTFAVTPLATSAASIECIRCELPIQTHVGFVTSISRPPLERCLCSNCFMDIANGERMSRSSSHRSDMTPALCLPRDLLRSTLITAVQGPLEYGAPALPSVENVVLPNPIVHEQTGVPTAVPLVWGEWFATGSSRSNLTTFKTPSLVAGLIGAPVVDVAAFDRGAVFVVGSENRPEVNSVYILGDNPVLLASCNVLYSHVPLPLVGLAGKGVVQVSVAPHGANDFDREWKQSVSVHATHALALTASGKVFSWGSGGMGRLGHGDDLPRSSPQLIKAIQKLRIVQVVAGYKASLARSATGEVFGWGSNEQCKLGAPRETKAFALPVALDILAPLVMTDMAIGCEACVFLSAGGNLYVLGRGSERPARINVTPATIETRFVAVSQNAAVSASGELYVFAHRSRRMVGVGVQRSRQFPTKVSLHTPGTPRGHPPQRVVAVASSDGAALVVTADGAVFGAGSTHIAVAIPHATSSLLFRQINVGLVPALRVAKASVAGNVAVLVATGRGPHEPVSALAIDDARLAEALAAENALSANRMLQLVSVTVTPPSGRGPPLVVLVLEHNHVHFYPITTTVRYWIEVWSMAGELMERKDLSSSRTALVSDRNGCNLRLKLDEGRYRVLYYHASKQIDAMPMLKAEIEFDVVDTTTREREAKAAAKAEAKAAREAARAEREAARRAADLERQRKREAKIAAEAKGVKASVESQVSETVANVREAQAAAYAQAAAQIAALAPAPAVAAGSDHPGALPPDHPLAFLDPDMPYAEKMVVAQAFSGALQAGMQASMAALMASTLEPEIKSKAAMALSTKMASEMQALFNIPFTM